MCFWLKHTTNNALTQSKRPGQPSMILSPTLLTWRNALALITNKKTRAEACFIQGQWPVSLLGIGTGHDLELKRPSRSTCQHWMPTDNVVCTCSHFENRSVPVNLTADQVPMWFSSASTSNCNLNYLCLIYLHGIPRVGFSSSKLQLSNKVWARVWFPKEIELSLIYRDIDLSCSKTNL